MARAGWPTTLLVALTLLIAESKPEDKATMVMLVVNLINQDN